MEEQRLDLISSLPCHILERINSLLPLKQAVRSSILSTAWRRIWTAVEVNLAFDANQISSPVANEEVIRVLCMLLKSYNGHEIWKLYLGKAQNFSEIYAQELTMLATKGVEKELHLEFFETQKAGIVSSFDLRLEAKPPGNFVEAATLKTLHLRSVSKLTKDMVSAFFAACPCLESLQLEKCGGLHGLDIQVDNHLQSLIISDCPQIVNISASAPGLKSFWYQGILPRNICLRSSSKLVHVMLNFKGGIGSCNEFDCEDVLSLLSSLKDIEILSLSGWLLEWLCSAGVIFSRLDFKFNKLKELYWFDHSINKAKRDSLACFLNATPFLGQLFVSVDSSHNPVVCPYFHQFWHEPHLWMDDAAVMSNASTFEHLKTVEFMGFANQDYWFLMDLLLKKATRLKSLTVTSLNNHSWQPFKNPQTPAKEDTRYFY